MRAAVLGMLSVLSIASFGSQTFDPPLSQDPESLWNSYGPISVKAVSAAFKSGNNTEIKLAHAYIHGTLDASEGIVWCNKDINPGGVLELASYALRKAEKTDPDARAASVIIDQFKKVSPCKDSK